MQFMTGIKLICVWTLECHSQWI